MNYITHSLAGVSVGILTVADMSAAGTVPIMAGAVLGALLPDIDHGRSWISHKAPIAGCIASGLFKHRGFLHTPIFIAIVAVVLSAGSTMLLSGTQLQIARWFIAGCIPGMLSHLIMDTLNVQGIPWLWPITDKKYHLLPIRTGSWGEHLVCGCLILLVGVQCKFLL